MASSLLRIGTRGSPMALAQAERTRRLLAGSDPTLAAPDAIEIVILKTTGDRVQDRALAELGGKGLFTKEIEEALLDRRVDVAVHSAKDVPTWLAPGLVLAAFLERDDPRDAFVSVKYASLADLPAGAVVGTAAPRRQAQLLHRLPALKIVPLRGNAGTRLRKLAEGAMDATLLGAAGLERIGRADAIRAILPPDEMLPAAGQGTIALECRADDATTRARLARLDHAPTDARTRAERALLAELEGNCRTPIAALAEFESAELAGAGFARAGLAGATLKLRALVALPDGSALHRTALEGRAADAERLGTEAGKALKARAGSRFFDAIG
ncbi:MAG TPA: hydroxymethylbilane synthase [Alphaproteobacteria bacterium]|nr:hydroxymethylbilane synthase [Alphaproteobacteria bacterium]